MPISATHPPSFARDLEIVEGGFASPHRLTSLPGKLSGCLYRADGSKVRLSERFGGYMGDYAVSDNPDRLTAPVGSVQTLSGRGLYLGHHMAGHYGHFITEGLSTFWIFEQHRPESFDYFLVHPFTFDLVLPPYAQHCLSCFGIDENRLVIVDAAPIRFEQILVPERLFRLNHSADPRLRWVYEQITRSVPSPFPRSDRLYLSRRRLNQSNFERVVANEISIEGVFRSHGFQVVYPESVPFAEQVALYRDADIMAGTSGSGLHNSLFMRPGTHVIELGDPRYDGSPAPTQVLCDSISGVRSTFVPFTGRIFGLKPTMLFDINALRLRLAELPSREEGGGEGPSLPRLWQRFCALVEIAYLSLRPSAGRLARLALKKMRSRTK